MTQMLCEVSFYCICQRTNHKKYCQLTAQHQIALFRFNLLVYKFWIIFSIKEKKTIFPFNVLWDTLSSNLPSEKFLRRRYSMTIFKKHFRIICMRFVSDEQGERFHQNLIIEKGYQRISGQKCVILFKQLYCETVRNCAQSKETGNRK